MQRYSWLKAAEYASLAGFVLGTFAATIYSQVAYAAVPLTLLLFLNIINRNQFQQQRQQDDIAEIAHINQLAQSLYDQVTALPDQSIDINPIYQSLSQLQHRTQRLAQLFNARPEIEQIQQLKAAIASYPLELKKLQSNIQKLAQQFNSRSEIEQIQELKEAIASLPNPLELNELQNDIQKLVQLFNARPETGQIQELREAIAARPNPLELEELQHQIHSLVRQFNTRPEIEQIQALTKVIAALPNPLELNELQQKIATQVDESVRKFAEQIRVQLALIEPYDYDLVIDRPGSRTVLMQALGQAQHRLILVCPWIGYGTDDRVMLRLEKLLQRNVCIDIGWGNSKDINDSKNSSSPIRQKLKDSGHYDNLPQLEALEHKYPQQFKLKLLGTHEKFLVCDSEWAMLGSHNFLTSNASSSERELGLKTNDPRIVADLIERFESAKDLEKEKKKKKIIG